MRCWVKSRNERNPYRLSVASIQPALWETAGVKPEEGGDDVKSIMAFMPRATHVLQWPVQRGAKPARGAIPKPASVQIAGLQLDRMKLESLVIADQHAAVNTFPGLVHTARHTMKVGCT